MGKVLPICMFLTILQSCATVGVIVTKKAPRKPELCSLDIYTREKEIPKNYEVVCLIDSKTSTSIFEDRTMAGAVEQARSSACKCGADGILILSGGTEGDVFLNPRTGSAILRAIRYQDNAAAGVLVK